jgi:hypothetical protein
MKARVSVDLWGGAMTCVLPELFEDISRVKPVPDHQELWFWGDTGTLVALELCEEVEGHEPLELSRFHWIEIATVNDSAWSQVVESCVLDHSCIPNLPAEHVPWVALCDGVQAIVKRVLVRDSALNTDSRDAAGEREVHHAEQLQSLSVESAAEPGEAIPGSEPRIVEVLSAVVPLLNVHTHMIISITRPLQVLEDTVANQDADAECGGSDSVAVGLDPMLQPLLLSILSTLQIHSWDLFG